MENGGNLVWWEYMVINMLLIRSEISRVFNKISS